MARKALLVSGIVATVFRVATDIIVGSRWEGYSRFSQSISELGAIGSPTRGLLVPLEILYTGLMITFALGVWRSAGGGRAVRAIALLLAANMILSLGVLLFLPMTIGAAGEASASVLHVVLMACGVVCFLLAIAFGAIGFRDWFRWLSIGILAAYALLTVIGTVVLPRLMSGPGGPSAGIQERTMVSGFLIWVVLLAMALWKTEGDGRLPETRGA
jgi:hypothetical protein